MSTVAYIGVILAVLFVLLFIAGFCYLSWVILNMEPITGEPYLKIETNLVPST
jgi:flagellar basal body-associated protein FliL